MNRLVQAGTFANLVGLDRKTLRRWHTDGRLRYDITRRGSDHADDMYYESTLDRFLAACRYNSTRKIRYDDLVTHRVILVSRERAMELTGLSYAALRARLDMGQLRGVIIRRDWHVTQESLNYYLQVTQYTPAMTAHIIGLSLSRNPTSKESFYRLLRADELVRHYFSLGNAIYITEQSIDAYLSDHLSLGTTPSEWREERLQDSRPLLTTQQITHQLNRGSKYYVGRKLERERLAHVWLPQKTVRLYSPTAFDTFMDMERRPTDAEIALWFGVHPTEVTRWRMSGLVRCPLSQHEHKLFEPLYEACWREIMEGQLTPGTGAHHWITARKLSPKPLFGRMLAAAELGISPDEVVAHAEAGRLRGIRTLTGDWRFTQRAVGKFRHALKAL